MGGEPLGLPDLYRAGKAFTDRNSVRPEQAGITGKSGPRTVHPGTDLAERHGPAGDGAPTAPLAADDHAERERERLARADHAAFEKERQIHHGPGQD